ncbi:esterase/lipase family protein [Nocardioides ungokensis]|uniref:esterase/lipase family protein n=1 Tax=Nocardioides ungokensis TaxID=1643322 RepID=UPI0015DD695A|nr:hypothetical protein [Nocardioides ungokensis]
MTGSTLASFLRPEGFERPRAAAVLREGSLLSEAGRLAARTVADRRVRAGTPYSARAAARTGDPVILVPGFLAGDGSLAFMARTLRRHGLRTYRSHIHANIGCTLNAAAQLETRLESIALRRGSRVQIVGTAWAGCWRGGSPYAVPTWSRASSRWAAPCWPRRRITPP